MSETLARLQRRLERYEIFIVIAVLLIAVLISWFMIDRLFLDVSSFVEPFSPPDGALAPDNLPAFSAAGEFYSLRYSVPISVISALVGGAIGLLLTYFAMKAAGRQGDVAILEFVEERISALRKLMPKTINAYMAIFQAANRSRTELSRRVIDAMTNAIDNGNYPDTPAGYRDFLEKDRAAAAFRQHFDRLCEALASLSDRLADLREDGFVRAYAERRVRNATAERAPLLYLDKHLPDEIALAEWRIHTDFEALLASLSRWAGQADRADAFNAYVGLPPEETTLEYVGATLARFRLPVKSPVPMQDGEIVAYHFNMGAAALLWALQVFSLEDGDIVDVFQSVFAGRAHALRDYLNELPVYRGATQKWMEGVNLQFENLNRLIYVEIRQGDTRVHAFYDPAVHGAIDPANLDA